jgi:putative FmdB family regulatory protein|nr:FmdB family zinc ribbon protein [uncultured Undibacterium sp.]
MPIYAYRCDECGFAKDVLQKMSEDPLTVCPECQQTSFKKQVTAAGFQLKGSGWYVTDFRGGNTSKESTGIATSVDTKPDVKGGESAPAAASTNTDSSTSTSTSTNATTNASNNDKAA